MYVSQKKSRRGASRRAENFFSETYVNVSQKKLRRGASAAPLKIFPRDLRERKSLKNRGASRRALQIFLIPGTTCT